MLDSPVRVALLARPGDARDQLRRALTELGASLVAEGDPAELDPSTVAGEKPTVVLVSLEPAIEDSLSRFDDLLAAPGIDVMYDDAETTRQLDGWDLARWARHLAAKLVGTDLLPPAPSGSDHTPHVELTLEPGAPRSPAEEMADEKLEDYAAESLDLSEWVPTEPSLAMPEAPAEEAPEQVAAVAAAQPDSVELGLDFDMGDLELALEGSHADAPVSGSLLASAPEEDLAFDPSDFELDLSALPEQAHVAPAAYEPTFETPSGLELALETNDAEALAASEPSPVTEADEPLLMDMDFESAPVSFSSFTDEESSLGEQMDDDVAALAAQLDAYQAQEREPEPAAIDFTSNDAPDQAGTAARPEDPVPAAAASPALSSGAFGSLELMPMDMDHSAPAPVAVEVTPPALQEPAPASAVSRLSLVDADPDAPIDNRPAAPGALLVVAGLGGPDAVRQLLSALPTNLPVPVLLYQHLDTGKHDRLLGQLAKASKLPLDLALEGKIAFAGRVGVLQPGVGIRQDGTGFTYVASQSLSDVAAALPASDSVVLLLSGADPAMVPAVLALYAAGALVLAQDPSSCFDSTAAGQLIEAGAVAASPAELARIVIERWK